MPYKSKAQAAFMHMHHPQIAARWDRAYGAVVQKDTPRATKKPTKRCPPPKG